MNLAFSDKSYAALFCIEALSSWGGKHMPLLLIGFLFIVLCLGLVVFYVKKTGQTVKLEKRGLNIALFVLSLLIFVISLKLFWNMGVYADEHGSSPVLVSGGWFWLSMDWLRQGLLFVLCVVLGLSLVKRSKGEREA